MSDEARVERCPTCKSDDPLKAPNGKCDDTWHVRCANCGGAPPAFPDDCPFHAHLCPYKPAPDCTPDPEGEGSERVWIARAGRMDPGFVADPAYLTKLRKVYELTEYAPASLADRYRQERDEARSQAARFDSEAERLMRRAEAAEVQRLRSGWQAIIDAGGRWVGPDDARAALSPEEGE